MRQLLSWFGAEHRDVYVSYIIHTTMRELLLYTEPDFNEQFIEADVNFRLGIIEKEREEVVALMNKVVLELISDRVIEWADHHPTKVDHNTSKDKFDEFAKWDFAQLVDDGTA